MVTWMTHPRTKLTLDEEEFEAKVLSTKVTRVENGFDSATIALADTTLYPDTVASKTPVKLDVKNATDGSWTTLLKGTVRFPVVDFSSKEHLLTLSCLGSGYGFGQMLVAEEYGAQSVNPSNVHLSSIIAGSINGIVPQFVNKVLRGANSGFAYNTTYVTIQGDDPDIQYISFPYKPGLNCMNDLMDLITALRDDAIGSHWIVTTDDKVRVKQINEDQTGWTKYYGGSQGAATLTWGEDILEANFEEIGPEANYILYYGVWRRPSSGDNWTNPSTAGWDPGANITLSIDSEYFIIGTGSLKATLTDVGGAFAYPSAKNAGWDFSGFGAFHIPTCNFYASKHQSLSLFRIYLLTDVDNYFWFDINDKLTNNDEFYHFSLPIGPFYDKSNEKSAHQWTKYGDPDWTDINYIQFTLIGASTNYVHVDGLHFGNAPVCRVAYNSSISPYCMKPITDDVGKDDSLVASDDSGLMAQLAKAELMRQQKTCMVGIVTTPMIKDVLPGQWFYIQGKDYRATKIVQTVGPKPIGFRTTLFLTDDLTNGRTRSRYEDWNKVFADARPEFQDRQATNIKAGAVDINVPRLAVDYA